MSAPSWLQEYYGDQFSEYNPELIADTQHLAIVRITNPKKNRAYSLVGYVLIRKIGRNGATPQESLFEGSPTLQDVAKMKARLTAAEAAFKPS